MSLVTKDKVSESRTDYKWSHLSIVQLFWSHFAFCSVLFAYCGSKASDGPVVKLYTHLVPEPCVQGFLSWNVLHMHRRYPLQTCPPHWHGVVERPSLYLRLVHSWANKHVSPELTCLLCVMEIITLLAH